MNLRVGILGCANIAQRSLIPAFEAHCCFRVIAIASRSLDKAKQLAEKYHCRACNYDDLVVANDIDLIYCPLPTGMHYQWVKRCLTQGKHVLCEKSLACKFEEVQNLVTIAREKHCFLMESFQFRFHAQNLYVKKLLADNVIGPIHHVVIRFGIPPFPDGAKNIRYSLDLGGGALLDNGAYVLKCATYLLGCTDVHVLASVRGGEDPSLGNVDLTGSIMLRVGGVVVQAAYGFDHYYQNNYEIWGKGGKISTVRAFTAREDFAAPVILETDEGKDVVTFNDNHFMKLMDYVAWSIEHGSYDAEYEECLLQARLLNSVKEIY